MNLAAYFLSSLPLAAAVRLQRRLAIDARPAMILCEHPRSITIGRNGSRRDVRGLDLPVRFVARGGGTMLHLPGQVSFYPVLPLTDMHLSPASFRDRLITTVETVLKLYSPHARGLWIQGRRCAHVGLAIRHGWPVFGATINVQPALEPFASIRVEAETQPMTSLQRESHHRVRIAAVRQQWADAVCSTFAFSGYDVFHHSPAHYHHESTGPR